MRQFWEEVNSLNFQGRLEPMSTPVGLIYRPFFAAYMDQSGHRGGVRKSISIVDRRPRSDPHNETLVRKPILEEVG